ncbi:HNH endonuclease signature motif containing protein [Tardiphaga sp. vice352]|uniref:HNH endonuclease n=1 Tax=Tardiphaga sp. vice352 TaxID=2592816 RepID=UPI00143D1E5E
MAGAIGAISKKGRVCITEHGYALAYAPGHPLAAANGNVYLHRKALYESIGDGVHQCHWCATPVSWRPLSKVDVALHVDHVDGDKLNNDASNLVASCHRCNSTRGLFMKWVMAHRDDPFLRALFDGAKLQISP